STGSQPSRRSEASEFGFGPWRAKVQNSCRAAPTLRIEFLGAFFGMKIRAVRISEIVRMNSGHCPDFGRATFSVVPKTQALLVSFAGTPVEIAGCVRRCHDQKSRAAAQHGVSETYPLPRFDGRASCCAVARFALGEAFRDASWRCSRS